MRIISIIAFLLFISSCSNESTATEKEVEVEVDTVAILEVNLDRELILKIVNDTRTDGVYCNGVWQVPVGTLVWNDTLAKAALDHSNDMQQNGYFSHVGQNGSSFSQRAVNAGYKGFPWGENIAYGYGTEKIVMDAWIASEGHCLNIMQTGATEIGIAKSNEGSHWTMVLGRARN